jgi:ornithine cyclodeaminase/alanine dehydrogenase-like protein (mu-crystallin family)
MRLINADDLDKRLDFPALIDALAEAFRGGFAAPTRHHYAIERPGAATATQLLMPAWTTGRRGEDAFIGAKIVSVFPDNATRGLPAVHGLYVLQSGDTGAPLAAIDGTRLTLWRTAAASALAARFLARSDARRHLMVGAGALAPFLIRAHRAVRPIAEVAIWNHRRAGAERLVAALARDGLRVAVADDLEAAARQADVISCATLTTAPLIKGAWLRAGQHVDLVGAFNLQMREVDDEALKKARVFIDTEAALHEGGDVAAALMSGAIEKTHVVADLAALCAGAKGRQGPDEITLFKSVGSAIEDLAAAMLAWKRIGWE